MARARVVLPTTGLLYTLAPPLWADGPLVQLLASWLLRKWHLHVGLRW